MYAFQCMSGFNECHGAQYSAGPLVLHDPTLLKSTALSASAWSLSWNWCILSECILFDLWPVYCIPVSSTSSILISFSPYRVIEVEFSEVIYSCLSRRSLLTATKSKGKGTGLHVSRDQVENESGSSRKWDFKKDSSLWLKAVLVEVMLIKHDYKTLLRASTSLIKTEQNRAEQLQITPHILISIYSCLVFIIGICSWYDILKI